MRHQVNRSLRIVLVCAVVATTFGCGAKQHHVALSADAKQKTIAAIEHSNMPDSAKQAEIQKVQSTP